MREQIKQKPLYQKQPVKKVLWALCSGLLFGLAALVVWLLAVPGLDSREEQVELQPIEIPEEVEAAEEEDTGSEEESVSEQEESPIYITETVSMELEDYKKLYQQLIQVGKQVEKSLVDISAVMTGTDWFDQQFVSQNKVTGILIGDNGMELLILTDYEEIQSAERLTATFFDYSTADAVLKKYDKNTGLAVLSVNLSSIDQSTLDIIEYADLANASSRTLRSGDPVIAVGMPMGVSGSVLFGNLTSVSQSAALYDSAYSILTTDIATAGEGSGVLVDWNGNIVGLIQTRYEAVSQKDTIQAYGISDMKSLIEHLSNNQDIVYMGIVGADVTTAISESEHIPVGVYISEVALGSPAMEAGIQPGDIITSMSGQTVTNQKDIMSTLLKCSNGQSVQVICQRPDKDSYQELELSVTLKILE